MSELKEKIFSKIDDQKPIEQRYFMLTDVLRMAVIGALTLFGAVVAAFLFWDWFLIADQDIFGSQNWLFLLFGSLPLAIFILLILAVFSYVIYRQTDWPMVQNRSRVFLVACSFLVVLTVVVLGFVQYSKPAQTSFRSVDRGLRKLPLRPGGPGRVYEENKDRGLFVGRVKSLQKTENGYMLVIENRVEELEFEIDSEVGDKLDLGDLVEIRTNKDDKTVEQVIRLPKAKLQR